MVKLSDIIRQDAEYARNVNIEVDERRDTVAIGPEDETGIFLQGEDGYEFIVKARELYEKAQDVTMEECYASAARPYIDCLL